jgi:hypothetical protein
MILERTPFIPGIDVRKYQYLARAITKHNKSRCCDNEYENTKEDIIRYNDDHDIVVPDGDFSDSLLPIDVCITLLETLMEKAVAALQKNDGPETIRCYKACIYMMSLNWCLINEFNAKEHMRAIFVAIASMKSLYAKSITFIKFVEKLVIYSPNTTEYLIERGIIAISDIMQMESRYAFIDRPAFFATLQPETWPEKIWAEISKCAAETIRKLPVFIELYKYLGKWLIKSTTYTTLVALHGHLDILDHMLNIGYPINYDDIIHGLYVMPNYLFYGYISTVMWLANQGKHITSANLHHIYMFDREWFDVVYKRAGVYPGIATMMAIVKNRDYKNLDLIKSNWFTVRSAPTLYVAASGYYGKPWTEGQDLLLAIIQCNIVRMCSFGWNVCPCCHVGNYDYMSVVDALERLPAGAFCDRHHAQIFESGSAKRIKRY